MLVLTRWYDPIILLAYMSLDLTYWSIVNLKLLQFHSSFLHLQCICMYMCTHNKFIVLNTYIYTFTHIHNTQYIHIYTYVYIYHTYIYTYVYIYHTYVYIYHTYIYLCIYKCICINRRRHILICVCRYISFFRFFLHQFCILMLF